ncbi:hypothetical protein BD626DRAFT_573443 [Schizophyllum amplum]|uniref:Uncharacterized protein n=1 Tax=Schizophyllum amplum TaxID=97359 RepID=A0A550C1L1_9AGAR|nr:hypothetical protein BD626DRAFT_573443 [Auriculariopsis ampla]
MQSARGLPENFHKSRPYRDALRALSGSLVPAGRPYSEADLFNIVNALESLYALSFVLTEMHNQPEDVRHTISTDIIPALWDWMLFFHPDADKLDESLLKGALWRYSQQRNPGVASMEYVHKVLASLFYTIPTSRKRRLQLTEYPISHPISTIYGGIGHYARFVRRLRCIIRMSKPDLEELAYQVELIRNMAITDTARPLLRGAFSLMGPAMRMYDLAATDTYHNIGDGQLHNEPTSAAHYLKSCCEIIYFLRDEIRSSQDVVRLVKGGIMRELYNYMRRLPDVLFNEPRVHPALLILSTVISPAAILPSVSNAISASLERDDLRSRLPTLASVSNCSLEWNNLLDPLKFTQSWTTNGG